MKYFITILATVLVLSSCKKNDEPMKVEGKNLVPTDSADKQTAEVNSAVRHMDKNKMKTPRGTLDEFLNLPEGGPLPHYLRPAQDIKLVKETESSSTFSFVSGSSGAKATIEVKRTITGSDTSWTVMPPLIIH